MGKQVTYALDFTVETVDFNPADFFPLPEPTPCKPSKAEPVYTEWYDDYDLPEDDDEGDFLPAWPYDAHEDDAPF